MQNGENKIVDMHCHVGLVGDGEPRLGNLSDSFRLELVYKTFLLYAGLKEDEASDLTFRQATENLINETELDHVVCLALDPVYDKNGQRHEDQANFWVSNDYVLDLRRTIGEKVLFGASVHPYDPDFENRVQNYLEQNAVLLKWLPSAQQFNLADDLIRDRLKFLATCRDGGPLPLLLHVGPEYAIPSTDERTFTYDFLSWSFWDKVRNFFRVEKWHVPQVAKVHENLRAGLEAGAIIIFAHCGLPYFAPNVFKKILEHSDFKMVRQFLQEYSSDEPKKGRCYADVSACATPFRQSYFKDIQTLPEGSVFFGSDFPTPVFELSADAKEMWEDFKAILKGDLKRLFVPQDNLLDVNYRELRHAFPDHPMFTNFYKLIAELNDKDSNHSLAA